MEQKNVKECITANIMNIFHFNVALVNSGQKQCSFLTSALKIHCVTYEKTRKL